MKVVKCKDTRGRVPRCVSAIIPDRLGVLSSSDMVVLGYIKCVCSRHHYLANADRACYSYGGS